MAILEGILSQVTLLTLVVLRRLAMDLLVHEEVETLPRLVVDPAVAEVILPVEDAVLIMMIGLNPHPSLLPRSLRNRVTLRGMAAATEVETILTRMTMMMTTKIRRRIV